MINIHEIKTGNFLQAEFGGQIREGEVIEIDSEDRQVYIQSGEQEYWFEEEHLYPVPLSDLQLRSLGFIKQVNEDGSVKYYKGPFRIVIPAENDFSSLEIWYREDRRHHPDVHFVHQLQNHYLQMTKVPLTKESI
jgi:hypothetical protein